MSTYIRFLIAALLVALAAPASAASIIVPRDTVVPVTIDEPLDSGTSRVGDTFLAHHEGANGGGFPEHTVFKGRVDSVTRASGEAPGQIGVSFLSAKLPDGSWAPINGQLTSLDSASVQTDPATGRLIGTSAARKGGLKFVAYGAGAGLVIGQLISKKPLLGTILGAAAGYLYGQSQTKAAVGKDVHVATGTPFGILLDRDVALSEPMAASSGAGPAGSGWLVTFKSVKPVVRGNDLMLPLRHVMGSIGMPFDYDSSTRTIRIDKEDSQVIHTVGTKLVYIDGKATAFDAASRTINGSIYLPASYIELLTNRTAYWNPKSGVLRIE